ncbi:hypothetical protein ElyMa_000292100 [Elysia marginata]|uniref:Uncharacterized protein n=1 Tax=Elysia marginata TaxID=1093978 RepID=A0AAV4F6I1_9GAST|nr:hypothetical protein ElyMa_000292100 [Elysia marginata]
MFDDAILLLVARKEHNKNLSGSHRVSFTSKPELRLLRAPSSVSAAKILVLSSSTRTEANTGVTIFTADHSSPEVNKPTLSARVDSTG